MLDNVVPVFHNPLTMLGSFAPAQGFRSRLSLNVLQTYSPLFVAAQMYGNNMKLYGIETCRGNR